MNLAFNKNRTITALVFLFCCGFANCFAQDSTGKEKTLYSVSAFFDVYYVYDFGKPNGTYRQNFFYNHNRHNELSLNLGYIKASAVNEKYRANLALMAGTYAVDNYAHEPEIFRRIFELNAGASLNKKNNLWLDAGIFASHMGFESAVSNENYTLTRSLSAENSPYYLAGGKLIYNPSSSWQIGLFICNGWQRIKPLPGSALPSFGTQVKYIRKKINYNWNSLTGTDDPDSLRRIRSLNNFFLKSKFSNGFDFIAGFDFGIQQRKKSSNEIDHWYSPVVIVRYQFSENWASAIRFENYTDKKNIIVKNSAAFSVNAISLNIDYHPAPSVLCRIEARAFHSKEKLFRAGNILQENSRIIAASVAVSL